MDELEKVYVNLSSQEFFRKMQSLIWASEVYKKELPRLPRCSERNWLLLPLWLRVTFTRFKSADFLFCRAHQWRQTWPFTSCDTLRIKGGTRLTLHCWLFDFGFHSCDTPVFPPMMHYSCRKQEGRFRYFFSSFLHTKKPLLCQNEQMWGKLSVALAANYFKWKMDWGGGGVN